MTLTLRQTAPPDRVFSPRLSYAWPQGSIQPYSSLWVTVMRFAMLNRPSTSILLHDLRGAESERRDWQLRMGTRRPWPEHESVDLSFFTRELGESLEAFRWSCVGYFPEGFHNLFMSSLKMCPRCSNEGFHTMLFSLISLTHCPVHGEALIERCPSCGGEIANRLVFSHSEAFLCPCKCPWANQESARHPISNKPRDEALGDIVDWLDRKGSKKWAFRLGNRTEGLGLESLRVHAEHWAKADGETFPPWLGQALSATTYDTDRTRCVERSGFVIGSLTRLPKTELAFIKGTAPLVQHAEPPRRLYKCVRRYLFKHLLGKRVNLLLRLAFATSLSLATALLRSRAFARAAWSILFWLLSSYWGRAEAEWLARTAGRPVFFSPMRLGSPTPEVLFYDSGHFAKDWIAGWLNASMLLDQWPPAEDFEAFTSISLPQYSDIRYLRRHHVDWWAWLDSEHHLCLEVSRRRPDWELAPRTSKQDRKAANAKRCAERRAMALERLCAVSIVRSDTGDWICEERLTPDLIGEVRIMRFTLGGGSRYEVAIAPTRTEQGARTWLLRCLQLPLRQTAGDISSGISMLKAVMRTYLTAFPAPVAKSRGS